MPKLYMLIGMPCCGKSTYRNFLETTGNFVVLSTDDYIENLAVRATKAQQEKFTYDDVFCTSIMKYAENHLTNKLKVALEDESDIIWDQTNLTKKSRQKKLQHIPSYYEKIAVVAPHPYDISNSDGYKMRLKERSKKEGKTIPPFVISSMFAQYEVKDLESEGFERVIYIQVEKELEKT